MSKAFDFGYGFALAMDAAFNPGDRVKVNAGGSWAGRYGTIIKLASESGNEKYNEWLVDLEPDSKIEGGQPRGAAVK